MMIKVGQGYDVHQLVDNRPCIIGGVHIPYEKGLLGHSDADVLLHAITDALLGAAGKGDIGHFFPDTDAEFEGANSRVLLQKVWQILAEEGYRIGNIDCTIVAERPKMVSYLDAMKLHIAEDCFTTIQQINIKATTSEKMGFIGRGEGVAAMCVVLIEK